MPGFGAALLRIDRPGAPGPEKPRQPGTDAPAAGLSPDRGLLQAVFQGRNPPMTFAALLVTLIIGAIAGWLAGLIVKGHGQGVLTNIVVGIVGALIASFLFPMLGLGMSFSSPILGSILFATIGAVILLVILGLIKRA